MESVNIQTIESISNIVYFIITIHILSFSAIFWFVSRCHQLDKNKISLKQFEDEIGKINSHHSEKYADKNEIKIMDYKITDIKNTIEEIKENLNMLIENLLLKSNTPARTTRKK